MNAAKASLCYSSGRLCFDEQGRKPDSVAYLHAAGKATRRFLSEERFCSRLLASRNEREMITDHDGKRARTAPGLW